MFAVRKPILVIFAATLTAAFLLTLSAVSAFETESRHKICLDKLSPGLRTLIELRAGDGMPAGASGERAASNRERIEIVRGRIKVYLYPAGGFAVSEILDSLRAGLGARATYSNRWFIEALLTPEDIRSLALDPAVAFIELPTDHSLILPELHPRTSKPSPPTTDPNLKIVIKKTWLKKYWRRGYKGAGIKVGVIDRAFRNLDEMIAAGVVSPIPAERRFNFVDTDDYGIDGPDTVDSVHGTSTLEVITTFAPEAELYAIRSLGYTGQFARAIDKVKELKLDFFLVNMGFTGYPDGDSPFSEMMTSAYSSKTLPIGSSNNQALSYTGTYNAKEYWTTFGDEQADYLEILDLAGRPVNVYLDWEPGKGADLILELYDLGGGSLKFIERVDRVGSDTHLECWEQLYSTYALERPAIRVRAKKLGDPVKFRVLNFDLWSRFSIVNSATTLTAPSDARNTFTVGAVRAGDFSSSGREFYSSFGPTADGRIKPDIMGAARLISHTWGDVEFFGTSCATPMVTGTLASYKSMNPKLKSSNVAAIIEAAAVDCGEPGKDNAYGAGIIKLPKLERKKKR
jgi:hypothetical protein